MSPDALPSRPRGMPHSRRGLYELVGADVLNAGHFNYDVVSDTRFMGDGKYFDLHFGKPDDFDENPRTIVVGTEVVRRGSRWFNRWYVGTIAGLGRGERGDEEVEDFDRQVDEILSGEEIPYAGLRSRVILLIPEEGRSWLVSDSTRP